MAYKGMDVDVVRQVGRELDSEANRLNAIVTAIDRLIGRGQHAWQGHGGEVQVSRWRNTSRKLMVQIVGEIHGLSQSAARNADAQDRASADLDGVATLATTSATSALANVELGSYEESLGGDGELLLGRFGGSEVLRYSRMADGTYVVTFSDPTHTGVGADIKKFGNLEIDGEVASKRVLRFSTQSEFNEFCRELSYSRQHPPVNLLYGFDPNPTKQDIDAINRVIDKYGSNDEGEIFDFKLKGSASFDMGGQGSLEAHAGAGYTENALTGDKTVYVESGGKADVLGIGASEGQAYAFTWDKDGHAKSLTFSGSLDASAAAKLGVGDKVAQMTVSAGTKTAVDYSMTYDLTDPEVATKCASVIQAIKSGDLAKAGPALANSLSDGTLFVQGSASATAQERIDWWVASAEESRTATQSQWYLTRSPGGPAVLTRQ